ncbi:DUF4342 domain-containing protein [Clostridiaceae bacterium OttesenSCG-928-D20]|nr:DUF4342 domain-containing protein [Clostridiaceae bacterium OttesenSCG-928-D20]
MTNIEKVDKLRERAEVSYAEAREALEKSDWDMLDAMVLLEKDGKVKAETSVFVASATNEEHKNENPYKERGDRVGFGKIFQEIINWLKKMLKIGNANDFVVEKGDEVMLNIPVTVLVIACIFMFWIIFPLMLVGLFFGYKYSFKGEQLGKESVNNVMGKANDVAESIKKEFTSGEEK